MNTNELHSKDRIGAWHEDDGTPLAWELFVTFDTEAERDEFVARFPKSANVKPNRLYAYGTVHPVAMANGNLRANDVNKGVNESGLRRFRQVIKVIGNELAWGSQYANTYESREAFEEAVR